MSSKISPTKNIYLNQLKPFENHKSSLRSQFSKFSTAKMQKIFQILLDQLAVQMNAYFQLDPIERCSSIEETIVLPHQKSEQSRIATPTHYWIALLCSTYIQIEAAFIWTRANF